MRRKRRSGDFAPIKLGDYVRLYLKSNRGSVKADITKRLEAALKAYRSGARCDCGAPIWVIGSAETGHMCFTCITGEADPSGDYEIAEACDKFLLFRNPAVGYRKFLPPPEDAFLERDPWDDPSNGEAGDTSLSRDLTDDDVPF